ncbi:DUF4224 domain-containing protein [Oligella sp. MSHR50489EDL]|uniref:DUF4224 domain-containing protein n=1 Tax=Oligella sp. MSHR50489EDL TaxID=3139409 RepID=UPI003D81B392
MSAVNDYLTQDELSQLTGYSASRRTNIINWLDNNKWVYVINKNGAPMVLREYRDMKLGIIRHEQNKQKKRHATEPNFGALGVN